MVDGETGFPNDPLFRNLKGTVIDPPAFKGRVADTHCHLDMMERPDLALARCAHHNVMLVVTIVEATENPIHTYDMLAEWLAEAAGLLDGWGTPGLLPTVRVVAGCHPQLASKYDKKVGNIIMRCALHPLTVAIGEIGLDYYYETAPRDTQKDVFKRQLELANELGKPVVLHVRDAHEDALEILQTQGMPKQGALLHCYTSDWETLKPFLDLGCHVAFGGAMTFNNGEAIRDAAKHAPLDRILTETDSPYMAPVPLRGTTCSPAKVVFTARALAEVREVPEGEYEAFYEALYDNAHRFYRIEQW
ncbi:MAG: TatD family hydrolase [Coriobacteriales bacterium]|jgi:TatD DNase family protein